MADLQQTYANFVGKEDGMVSRTFVKVCQESKLVDKSLNANDVDLIFRKVATKGKNKIDFAQFKTALGEIATKKGVDQQEIIDAVTSVGGPTFSGTKAETTRLHDDKTTYTGTHVYGGPESVNKGGGTATTLASKGMTSGQGGAAQGKSPASGTTKTPTSSPASPEHADVTVQKAPVKGQGTCEGTFKTYCGTHPDMDGKSFNKLCKDCGLMDANFNSTSADLVFNKAVTKGKRRLTYAEFKKAAEDIAKRKEITAKEVMDIVAQSGGPVLTGTHAQDTRFHDDKSTYTGTHVYGGPEAGATGQGTSAQSAAAGMNRT